MIDVAVDEIHQLLQIGAGELRNRWFVEYLREGGDWVSEIEILEQVVAVGIQMVVLEFL